MHSQWAGQQGSIAALTTELTSDERLHTFCSCLRLGQPLRAVERAENTRNALIINNNTHKNVRLH